MVAPVGGIAFPPHTLGWTRWNQVDEAGIPDGTVKLSSLAAFSPPAATAKSLILSL